MKIISVNPESPLFGKVRNGYRLIAINGETVKDNLDYMFKSAEDSLALDFLDTKGNRCRYRIDFDGPCDPGLVFENDKIIRCKNNCIFCFIHQQPKGMRRSLYVKDDDYRLSFIHGNFISLSNISGEDLERIVEQRLSPLYISVHATDDKLRRSVFKNKKLPSIMPLLKRLVDARISLHTQVVVCPGINDGENLDRTIDDLFGLHPGVMTVGIVPVGLTRYRQKLPELKLFDSGGAGRMIDYIHTRQKRFLKSVHTRFIFAADEYYVMAGRDIPKLHEYEEMAQFENGIGMLRQFITDFNRRKRSIKPMGKSCRIAVLTGESAYRSIKENITDWLKTRGIKVDLVPVKNRFWGDSVTVSGLLTGRDLSDELSKSKRKYDTVILPPNCLNNDDLFLDDITLTEFKKTVPMKVVVGSYNLAGTLREVLQ